MPVKIKLIAMDMDGTLLRSDNTISKKTKEVLIKAQQQGIRLVLASGRSYRKLYDYAQELRMPLYGGFLIEVNGIALYDLAKKERKVFHQLRKEEACYIFDSIKDLGVEIIGMVDDGLYDYIPESMMEEKIAYRREHGLSEDYPWTAGAFAFVYDNRVGYPRQYTIKDASEFPETMNKISVCHHPEKLQAILPEIRKRLGASFWIGLTSPSWLEIMPKNVTKGSALATLAQTLAIPMEEAMAFGDGENDMEMLQIVKYGIAMKNGLDNVREIGYAVCEDNNHDGIAHYIEENILSKSDAIQ